MSLIFYYAPWSSATTCLWALEELGVPHERVKLDLKAKDTKKPEYLKLNPNGLVPLIVQDGVPIYESIAILAHLGETYGVEKKLFPAPGITRAQAFQWLAWANVTFGAAVGRYMGSTTKDKAEVEKLLAILDAGLAGRTWLVGDTFTLVDVHLAGAIGWSSSLGFDMKSFTNIESWMTKCKARPGYAVAMGG